jgi:hypothetical protein
MASTMASFGSIKLFAQQRLLQHDADERQPPPWNLSCDTERDLQQHEATVW